MEFYVKDFDQWNFLKKRLDVSSRAISFCEKEIWWCCAGVNVGSEQDGKGDLFLRPVYILRKINSKTFVGIPLSTKLREDLEHKSFYFNDDVMTAKISQIKVFDKRRLSKRIGITSDYLHSKLKKATAAFILA